jgi:hypothetical protein
MAESGSKKITDQNAKIAWLNELRSGWTPLARLKSSNEEICPQNNITEGLSCGAVV